MNTPLNSPKVARKGLSVVRSRMRCRAIRKELLTARQQGATAALKGVSRDANPYAGASNVSSRYEWFTGYDLP